MIVAFMSYAGNLVAGDTNWFQDVFVHEFCLIDATWSNYGAGFPGTNGVPSLTASTNPVLGTTITIDLGNSLGNWTIGFLLAGLSEVSVPTSLGGTLLVGELFLLLPLPIAPGGSSLSADLPIDPALCGLAVYTQMLELDADAAKGVSFTPGLELVFGH
jgi:hypothetical protein